MPLYLVRQDLTKMTCDAIVSPSNTRLKPGGGLDAVIHEAAGPQLLEVCRTIGGCPVGEARSAPGFDLPCRWVIFTAGPVWRGGWLGERKKLERCYRSCFFEARRLGCKSLAIPLIGAGSNGVPLETAFSAALQGLEDCLLQSDMTIYLVVFDSRAFLLSGQLRDDVQSFIDDHYVREHLPPDNRSRYFSGEESAAVVFDSDRDGRSDDAEETLFLSETISFEASCEAPSSQTPRRRAKERRHDEETFAQAAPALREKQPENPITFEEGTGAPQFRTAPIHLDLRVDEPFSLKLLRLIDRKKMDDVACYKKANVSRQTWYKIMNDPDYKPNKKTVLSFAVALELTLEETQMLLESVGYVLSQSSLFDVILMFCLSHGIHDVATIDAILFHYDQEMLYSKA